MAKLYKELQYDTDKVMQPGDALESPDGKTLVRSNNDGTATITSGSPLLDTATLGDLAENLGLSDGQTLGDVETALGLVDTNTLGDAQEEGGQKTEKLLTAGDLVQPNWTQSDTTKPDYIKNKPTEFKPTSHVHYASDITSGTLSVSIGGTGMTTASNKNAVVIGNSSTVTNALQTVRTGNGAFYATATDAKPAFGTLPVAQGGTGITTTTNVNAVVIGNSSNAANAMQAVATASGAFYATGANAKPTFGALPVAQGGTGSTTAAAALTALGAASSTHTHSSYLDKTIDNTIYRSIFIDDSNADGRALKVGCVDSNDSGPVAIVGRGNFVAGWNDHGTLSPSTVYANGCMWKVNTDNSELILNFPNATGTYTLATTGDIPNPRYAISTPTQATSGTSVSLTLNDRSINQVSLASTVTTATISFPAKTTGYARDFFVRLTITGSTVPAITWQESNGGAIDFDVDDDAWADIEQGVNILMFTETKQVSAS